MNKQWLITSLLIIVGLLVTACGGGNGDAPVAMEKYETGAFTIEHPKDWNIDSTGMMGITIFVTSSADIKADSFMGAGEAPDDVFGDAPGVMVMTMPAEMTESEGPLADEIKSLPQEEPGVEIISQGDITVDGITGYQLAAQGEFESLGGRELAVYTAVLEHEATPLMFMGISPDKDVDKNLDIFEYMFKSIKFK